MSTVSTWDLGMRRMEEDLIWYLIDFGGLRLAFDMVLQRCEWGILIAKFHEVLHNENKTYLSCPSPINIYVGIGKQIHTRGYRKWIIDRKRYLLGWKHTQHLNKIRNLKRELRSQTKRKELNEFALFCPQFPHSVKVRNGAETKCHCQETDTKTENETRISLFPFAVSRLSARRFHVPRFRVQLK